MRRTRLIWFALGASTILMVSIFTMLFASPNVPLTTTPVLELIEPEETGEDFRDEDMIANVTGELARNCGAKFFETTFLYNDHSPTMEIQIIPENAQAIQCILLEAKRRSIQTNIIFREAIGSQAR